MNEDIEATAVEETRLKPPESGAEFNQVEDVIYRRRSVRFYRKKQVPEYLVRRILEVGRFAPSAGNGQTWKFIVVQDQDMIHEMTNDIIGLLKRLMNFTDYIETPSSLKERTARLFQRLSNNSFHPIPFAAMKLIVDGKLGVWHGAPTVILLLADRRSPGNPAIDIGISGQNMVLTAHTYGLGTCWVSFCTPLSMMKKWRDRLGIRYPYKLITSIALGYPRGNPDGYVTRETQAIDWFADDGNFKVVY
jgi:nitroreductase